MLRPIFQVAPSRPSPRHSIDIHCPAQKNRLHNRFRPKVARQISGCCELNAWTFSYSRYFVFVAHPDDKLVDDARKRREGDRNRRQRDAIDLGKIPPLVHLVLQLGLSVRDRNAASIRPRREQSLHNTCNVDLQATATDAVWTCL